MNKLQLFAYPVVTALALAAAVSAHAEVPAQGKTRAEVKAELMRALADGSYKPGAAGYDPLAFINAPAPAPKLAARPAATAQTAPR